MRFLAIHPGPLMYTKVFLRLEPLGLELIAQSARRAGHDVRLIDLQVDSHATLLAEIDAWRPEAVAFSCNYLANVPEIVDLSKTIKQRHPSCFVFVGGHSASFTANDLLAHGEGAIDAVLKGQTNFFKMLWKFNSVYDPKLLMADHARAVQYEMSLPGEAVQRIDPRTLYVHASRGRDGRAIDDDTERFVDKTRVGAA